MKPVHAADRLLAAIQRKRAPVCVGLDPVIRRLPGTPAAESTCASAQAIADFSIAVINAVSPHVPCVKVQAACFERYGAEGVAALDKVLQAARHADVEIILDAKRGDIGVTAEHYAAGAFEPPSCNGTAASPDWLTINSYLGADGITPFLREGHGAFALVRTSNPGGDAIQNLQLADGRTVAQAVAQVIAQIGSAHVGERGYSSLGAVVGATKRQDASRLRELMPQQMFLVPGYGAQGGGVDDVLPCFKADSTGAIVTASRSVIYAFKPGDPKWINAIADAAAQFADELGRATGLR